LDSLRFYFVKSTWALFFGKRGCSGYVCQDIWTAGAVLVGCWIKRL